MHSTSTTTTCRICRKRACRAVSTEETEFRQSCVQDELDGYITYHSPLNVCTVCLSLLEGCVRMSCLQCEAPETAELDETLELHLDFDDEHEQFYVPRNWCSRCHNSTHPREVNLRQLKDALWERHEHLV